MATILGAELTQRDLIPIYLEFMHDLDEVRVGILEHLYEFFLVRRVCPHFPEYTLTPIYSNCQ
jgi:serine/threonine-protein phosphatase 4 regulatory subunit 1